MRRHMNWTFGKHCPVWGTNTTLISTKKCTRHIQSSLNIHRKQEWQKTADTPSRTTIMLYDYTWRAFTEANTWGRWGMQPHKLPSTVPAMLPGRPLLVISSAPLLLTQKPREVFRALGTPSLQNPSTYCQPVVLKPILSHSSLRNSFPNLSAWSASNLSNTSSAPLLTIFQRMQRVLTPISWSLPASQLSIHSITGHGYFAR